MERRCVEILTFAGLDKPLSYAIPPELDGIVAVGMLVRVPLGRSVTLGIVTDVHRADADALPYRVREIIAIEYDYPLLGRDTMALVEWMSRYYAASNKSVLEAIIPAAIRNNISAKFSAKVSLLKFLSDDERSLLKRRAPKQHELYQFLLENGAVERSAAVKFSSSAVNSLLGKGIIGETFRVQDRLVYGEFTDAGATSRAADIALTEEQRMAADDIAKSLTIGKFCTHLLHGVTGSGKTEVYACGIRRVLDGGGDVIYLVPELALTPQTVSRIRRAVNLYGVEVVVWHSGLSDGERRDAWLAMASGRSRVVIGARSAIFAPLKNVRLIIVDEEHEVTYKQSDSPRYHARDVAVYRAKLCDAVCILGSATPSMESLFNVSLSKYKLNCLKNRVDGSKLPAMEVVDMRHERTSRGVKIISSRLMELVAACLANGEQTILFLNKRGYASVVFCQCCDYVAACPHCSMSLTYHRQQHLLRCHICGYVEELPTKCPKCGSGDILQTGIGTQKLVGIVSEAFPDARVERIDSDATRRKDEFLKILSRFGSGEIDILVGTQMISKGLDFPNVSLVGIVNIDNAMHFPDFRTNERVFQSIVQVSGRSGRGSKPGTVVLQTRCPHVELIKLSVGCDVDGFFRRELLERSEFFYPPLSRIIRLIFSGRNQEKIECFARKFSDDLLRRANDAFDIRGPAQAAIPKIKDRFRVSTFCFTKNVSAALEIIRMSADAIGKYREITVTIDVDPVDML